MDEKKYSEENIKKRVEWLIKRISEDDGLQQNIGFKDKQVSAKTRYVYWIRTAFKEVID